jgi:hypothetical protein
MVRTNNLGNQSELPPNESPLFSLGKLAHKMMGIVLSASVVPILRLRSILNTKRYN